MRASSARAKTTDMATAAPTRPASLQHGGMERLATLVHLERRARAAENLAELGFVMVNETLGLMLYRQAVLLGRSQGGQETLMVSGVSEPAKDAPFTIWIRRALQHLAAAGATKCRAVTAADLSAKLAVEWGDWLPPVLVLLPLQHRGLDFGLLALARDEAPAEAELRILDVAADAYAHSWAALVSKRRLTPRQMRRSRRFGLLVGLAAGLAGLSVVPVPSAVIAPAEVIPLQPAVVRSALDGVIDRVLVAPNQFVSEGQVLAQLDTRRLRTQLQAARVAAAATETELRQARQSSVTDPRARAQIPGLQGRLDQQVADVRFLESQDERLEIRAPRSGIAIFESVHEWLGRPVATGERIMQIADPEAVELEIRLPAADAIQLDLGARVLFFSNVDPQRPAEAALIFLGYRATLGADAIVAYRLKASFVEGQPSPRLGLKGTAKVYGRTVLLGYYLLRRPLASARSALGL